MNSHLHQDLQVLERLRGPASQVLTHRWPQQLAGIEFRCLWRKADPRQPRLSRAKVLPPVARVNRSPVPEPDQRAGEVGQEAGQELHQMLAFQVLESPRGSKPQAPARGRAQ